MDTRREYKHLRVTSRFAPTRSFSPRRDHGVGAESREVRVGDDGIGTRREYEHLRVTSGVPSFRFDLRHRSCVSLLW